MVAFRRGANPLHGEVLECQQQFAEIATSDFDFVIGKHEAEGFPLIRASERCGDEMLKREDVKFAASRFETQAGRRGFTLPTRWSGRDDWFVGF